MVDQVVRDWQRDQQRGRLLRVIIRGLPYANAGAVVNCLNGTPGLEGVDRDEFDGGDYVMDVRFTGDPRVLTSKLLEAAPRGVVLEVVRAGADKIELQAR